MADAINALGKMFEICLKAKEINKMQYPSIADILEKHGYTYEAGKVRELTKAVTDYETAYEEWKEQKND